MCIITYFIVLRPILNTTYKGEIQVKIYTTSLHHELFLFQQSMNCFHYVPDNEIEDDILGWNLSYYILDVFFSADVCQTCVFKICQGKNILHNKENFQDMEGLV